MQKSILFKKYSLRNQLNILRKASWKNPNLYEVLGVSKTATAKEIKVAYYQKCKEFHPDTNKNNNKSHDKFINIQKAYDTLSDNNTRRDYDLSLQGYSAGTGNRYTRSNPADVYQTYHNNPNYHQTYYHYGNREGMNYSEFEKFMRARQAFYAQYNSQNKNINPDDNNFSSPLKVMIYLIIGIGLFEAFTVSWIYDRDMNYLHDNNYRYSPNNRQALIDFRNQVNQADMSELEDKIRDKKEMEEKAK